MYGTKYITPSRTNGVHPNSCGICDGTAIRCHVWLTKIVEESFILILFEYAILAC